MSASQPRLLGTYNSLTDKHLVGYFSNPRIRKHLQRSGLISRSGRIIAEKEYWQNAQKKEQQRYAQECLARAIFREVLDMEHRHQLEIKRTLENSAKKERVQKIKVEKSRKSAEGVSSVYAPHPPLGPRNHYRLHPFVVAEPSGRLPQTSWRPNTAPGNMLQHLRLQPLCSCAARGSAPKASSSKQKHHTLEHDQQLASGVEKSRKSAEGVSSVHTPHPPLGPRNHYRLGEPSGRLPQGERSELRLTNSVEYGSGISPYKLPVINNHMIPVPPPPLQKGDKSINVVRTRMLRGRLFHPTTTANDTGQLLPKNSGGFPKPSLHSNAFVTMIFLGKSLHLSHDSTDHRDEIKVYQQHCGGENICVYKGKLLEGETFQFISKRHRGFPFSLTFFLNGMQVDRLSCCCEYKYHKNTRLGGRRGYFGFLNVEGASPCYRCIIAMGLDKKPSSPKRKMESQDEKYVDSWRDEVHSEPSKSSIDQKSSKDSVLVTLPCHEESVETSEDKMETRHEYRKEEEKICGYESEDSQEDIRENEYDDFEADEDNHEEQTSDQMNGMSKSSSDDKTLDLDYEKESSNLSQKALQASDSEKDESDAYSDSASEDDKQDRRPARPLSSISTQYSSEDDSHAEVMKDDVEDEEEYNTESASDNASHAQYVNENRENKQLGLEENLETSALEKEGIDEAGKSKPEGLTTTGDTGIFHENIMAVQHQSLEVNGECKQARSVKNTTGEDGEKNASTRRNDWEENLVVPLESNTTDLEGSNEESSQRNEDAGFEDYKSIQEELAKVIGNDHHVNSEPESSDSHADEEEENTTNTECDAKEDGAFLAEGTRTLDVQKAAEQAIQEGHMIDEREALEKEDFVAEGDVHTEETGEETAWMGDFLPKEGTVAVMLVKGQLAGEESAPEDSTKAEEDPKGRGTGKGMESGVEVACREQEVLMERESEAVWGMQTPVEKDLAGVLLHREADGVVSEREEVAVDVSEGKETTEEVSEAKEAVGATEPLMEKVADEIVSEAEEAMEEGGSAGKDVVADSVCEGEEAVEDAHVAGEGIIRVVGPEGDEAADEAISEREEDVEKPGVLLKTLGDTSFHTGEATLGGVDFVKLKEFSQLKAAREEQMEMGEAATSETDKASEVERNSLSAEDTVEESVDSEKGSVWQVAPGFKALVDARGDPISEFPSKLEETTTAGEKDGSAETCSSGTPSLGSKAKSEHAMEERLVGEVMGLSPEKGRAESGSREGTIIGAAGPSELVDGKEGSLDGAKERGKEKFSGEEVVDGAALPALVLSVGRMGEAGLVAFAVVDSRAELGALADTAEQEVARGRRMGEGVVVQEKVMGVAWRGLRVMEAAAPEGVSAEERGTAWETGRDREGGVANGAMDCGQGSNWEKALGCEERKPVPAEAEGLDEAGQEWNTACPLSAQHGEPCEAMSLGEQLVAENSLSTSTHGDGGTGPIGRQPIREDLCLGTQLQPAAPGTGADENEDEDGSQEGTKQVGMKAEAGQPGLCENMGEREGMDVLESTWSTEVRVQRRDSPVGERPDAPGATDAGEESHDPCEDAANPDAVVVPSVQPRDGEETLL